MPRFISPCVSLHLSATSDTTGSTELWSRDAGGILGQALINGTHRLTFFTQRELQQLERQEITPRTSSVSLLWPSSAAPREESKQRQLIIFFFPYICRSRKEKCHETKPCYTQLLCYHSFWLNIHHLRLILTLRGMWGCKIGWSVVKRLWVSGEYSSFHPWMACSVWAILSVCFSWVNYSHHTGNRGCLELSIRLVTEERKLKP